MRIAQGLVFAVALLALATTAGAEQLFVANIDGSQAGVSSSATGTGNFTLRDDDVLEYVINFDPLASGELVSHVHGPAPAGQPAGVVFPLPLGNPKVGTYGPLDRLEKADLLAGLWYVNIHSNQFPGGEIRGQILPLSVPVDEDSWSAVKSRFDASN